jgi:hypothetical protein
MTPRKPRASRPRRTIRGIEEISIAPKAMTEWAKATLARDAKTISDEHQLGGAL